MASPKPIDHIQIYNKPDPIPRRRFPKLHSLVPRLHPDMVQKWANKRHSLLMFVFLLAFLIVSCRGFGSSSSLAESARRGLLFATIFFLAQGLLYFPSGSFERPHPIFWRLLFGLSVIYAFILVFVYFLTLDQVRLVLSFVDPTLNVRLEEKEYAADCSVSFTTVWSTVNDIFFFSHLFGWAAKAMMIRHRLLLWVVSVLWELIEKSYTFALENFKECWWDSWLIDVLICNGVGIEAGMMLGDALELVNYDWAEIDDKLSIAKFGRRLKKGIVWSMKRCWRITEWKEVTWEEVKVSRFCRYLVITTIIAGFSAAELNIFFLKHLFWIPPEHWLIFARVILIGLISLPTLRQIYLFSLHPREMPLGMQAWVMIAIILLEAMIIRKFWSREYTSMPGTIKIYWVVGFSVYLLILKVVVKKTKGK